MSRPRYTQKDVAVVIPVYKEELTEAEQKSLHQCFKVLARYTIIFAAPIGLSLKQYGLGNKVYQQVIFKKEDFRDIPSYNKLLISPRFYKSFLNYKYILIYQLDAFVFRDELLQWCAYNYDYIGAPSIDAPWRRKIKQQLRFSFLSAWLNAVGNGGLSLRKVHSAYSSSIIYKPLTFLLIKIFNEDVVWSSWINTLNPWYRVAPFEKALSFAFEDHPANAFELNNSQLPFGCHAWEKYDPGFWKEHLDQEA